MSGRLGRVREAGYEPVLVARIGIHERDQVG